MKHSQSTESDSHSAGQGIPRTLCKPNVHYRVHKSLFTGLYSNPDSSGPYLSTLFP